ncbi:MAG: prepilin-type N-terminal cleavage/methylation domain-containing protein [bacterium]|nr:prepilin-type N-terminal cleavage/methylation domain-containing protein [bacterium]
MKRNFLSKRGLNRGFSLMEIILVISITSLIALVISKILEQTGNMYFRMIRNADANAQMQQTYYTMISDIRESVGAGSVSASVIDLDKKYYYDVVGTSLFAHVIQPYNGTTYQLVANKINVSNFWDPIEDVPSSTTYSFAIPRIEAGTAWNSVARGGNYIYTVTLKINVNGQIVQSQFKSSPMVEN